MNVSTPVRNHNINLNCDVTPVEKINQSVRRSPRQASKSARTLLENGGTTSPVLQKRRRVNSSNSKSQKSRASLSSDSGVFSNPQKEVSKVSFNASSDLFGDSITSDIIPVSLKKSLDSKSSTNDFTGASLFLNDSGFNLINQSPKERLNQTLEDTINLSDQAKQQLKNNVDNVTVDKLMTTGWSQLDDYNESLNIPSLKEYGPFFGLPLKVKDLLKEHKGIENLYDWQKECLELKAIKDRINLVYALPTSGGKTLVAELLIFKELLCHKKNVLFVLPFISIVQEKVRSLSQFALELGFSVEEYAAGKGVIPPKKRKKKNSVIIATIEKGLLVVTSLLESKRLNEIGLVVVDELHLLSEESRGATLEMLLTHVLYSGENIHVIGMSATIGNLEEVSRFLKAESYSGTFRPVELTEYVKCGEDIFQIDGKTEEMMKQVRKLASRNRKLDPDGIGALVEEIIPNDSVLIFCATKKNCENVALLLCKVLSNNLCSLRVEEKLSFYRALLSETNNQICPIIKKTIPFGVAYHHSGLTTGERKLLEEAFRDGIISVICCTSTLAAGVNLPAKRVILRSPYVARDFINLSTYKQMTGRAGRAGMGSEGESYLICQPSECPKVHKLLRSKMNESVSKLDLENCRSLLLTAVGLGTADTRQKLRDLLNRTFLKVQEERLKVNVKEIADSCIKKLFKDGALKIRTEEDDEDPQDPNQSGSKLAITFTNKSQDPFDLGNSNKLMISRLGKAAMKGGLSLERAHELFQDLVKAQQNLVLLTNLHLLYLITPYEMLDQIKPNYSVYFNRFMKLDDKEIITAKAVGLTENMMSKLVAGIKPKNVPELSFKRFYVSLILNELWKNQGIWDVANLFQITRGLVQTLMTSAATFANNVLRFCDEIQEMWSFKALLQDFAPRLAHCCTPELLPLMDLPAVKKGRAKQLYEAGYTNLMTIVSAKPDDLVKKIDHMPKRVATQIIATAKLLLLEKAENLKEEAEEVMECLVTNAIK